MMNRNSKQYKTVTVVTCNIGKYIYARRLFLSLNAQRQYMETQTDPRDAVRSRQSRSSHG